MRFVSPTEVKWQFDNHWAGLFGDETRGITITFEVDERAPGAPPIPLAAERVPTLVPIRGSGMCVQVNVTHPLCEISQAHTLLDLLRNRRDPGTDRVGALTRIRQSIEAKTKRREEIKANYSDELRNALARRKRLVIDQAAGRRR